MTTCKAVALPLPLDPAQELDAVRANIALAYVNRTITQHQAGQAVAALERHWAELGAEEGRG